MESLSVDSVLDAVTVYAEGAICRRVARVQVRAAEALRLQLTHLPLSMLEHSLRASVLSGPDEARVRDVRPGFDVLLPPDSDLPADEKALLRAHEEVTRLEQVRERILREVADVSALQPAPPPKSKDEPTRASRIDSTLALAGFVDEQLRVLHAKWREVDAQLEDARNELLALQHRLSEASSSQRQARARLLRTAVITLSAPKAAGEVELALEYLVPGATWAPAYELRLERSLAKGSLFLRATVAQRTGEDWKGVKLSLSTARLDRRIEIPELASLRIGKSQPPVPRSGWREPPPGLAELFAGYDFARINRPQGAPTTTPLPPPPPPLPPPSAATYGAVSPRDEESAPELSRMISGSLAELSDDDEGMALSAPMEEMADVENTERADEPMPPPMAKMAPPGGGAMPRSGARPAAPPRSMPAPAMAPAPSMAAPARRREMSKKRADTGEIPALQLGGLQREMRAQAPQEELELSTGLLDYARLVMGGPDEPSRGKLRPPTSGESWELALFHRVSVHIEVESILRVRRQEAARVVDLPRPPHARDVRESAGSYDYRFDSERRADVVSDGAWHTVPVCGADVEMAPEYVCVPSVDPKVYRTVKLRNVSKHALLAGPMDVTLGDEFLMTVPMPTLAPGAEERVGLGVEEGIKVSRNTRFNEASGGLFGGAAVLEHGVEIEVANRLSRAVEVEVLERVPVTQEKDIKIEEGPVQPPWVPEKLPRNGVLVEGTRAWRLKLAAAESKKLSANFAIRIPGQKVLVGGNRRV